MARTKGAKDKKPRKKRISQTARILNLNGTNMAYVHAEQKIRFQ